MSCYAGETLDVPTDVEWVDYDHLLNTQAIVQILQTIDEKRAVMGLSPYAWTHAGTSPAIDAMDAIDWDTYTTNPLQAISAQMAQGRSVLAGIIDDEWIISGIRWKWYNALYAEGLLPSTTAHQQKETWLAWVTDMRQTLEELDRKQSYAWEAITLRLAFFPTYGSQTRRDNYINTADLRTDLIPGKTHTRVWRASAPDDTYGHLASLSDWQEEVTATGSKHVYSIWDPEHDTGDWGSLSSGTIFDSGAYWNEYAADNFSREALEATASITARLFLQGDYLTYSGDLIIPEIIETSTITADVYPDSGSGDLDLSEDTIETTIPEDTYTFAVGSCTETFGTTNTTLTLTPNPFPDLPYYAAAGGNYPGFSNATNEQGGSIEEPDDIIYEGCVDADGRVHL